MNEEPEMQDEYDFSGGQRGRYAARYAQGMNLISLARDVVEVILMKQQPKSDIMTAVHETAEGLNAAGVLPVQTLREFDALCLTPVLSAPEAEDRRRELENDTHE